MFLCIIPPYWNADIEIFKRLDQFLLHDFFAGTELIYTGSASIILDASIWLVARHWYTKEGMEYYHDKPFRGSDGKIIDGDV